MVPQEKVIAAIGIALNAYLREIPQATVTLEEEAEKQMTVQAVSPWRIFARQQLVQRRRWWQSLRDSSRRRPVR